MAESKRNQPRVAKLEWAKAWMPDESVRVSVRVENGIHDRDNAVTRVIKPATPHARDWGQLNWKLQSLSK